MIPTIRWELRQRRTAIFWWCLVSLALVAVLLLIYPSIRDQAAQLSKLLNQLPNGVRQLKTGNSTVDIGSPVGYLNSQVFYITLPMVFIILAITRGSGLIGRDEQDHTLELLLARPVSRGRLLLAKAVSGVLELTLVAVVSTATLLVLAHAVKLDVGIGRLLLTSLFTALFSLSFGAISFALTAYGRLTKRASTAIAVVIAFGGYILVGLESLSHYITTPAKLFPYHYFIPQQLLMGHVAKGIGLYLLGVFVVCALLAWTGFRRRDIE